MEKLLGEQGSTVNKLPLVMGQTSAAEEGQQEQDPNQSHSIGGLSPCPEQQLVWL